MAEDLLEDHVACEEEGEADRDHKEDVGPRLLGGGGHELGVVETEEEADGEEGEQAAVEDLSNQNNQAAVRCKNILKTMMRFCVLPFAAMTTVEMRTMTNMIPR